MHRNVCVHGNALTFAYVTQALVCACAYAYVYGVYTQYARKIVFYVVDIFCKAGSFRVYGYGYVMHGIAVFTCKRAYAR